ncbi:enoyl-coa hydratase/isomerase family protein [Toxoplasma gondii TgCatPRC2]|uniref:Enoyl-coa hydratase/isomerase family protein n=3 Tax=Toxoplasma gondii TaxID=5811 RepID=B6KFN8_TOXGV|nr:enoyl-coa hydratase/isomerase family protein [Toxoplasma gondii ME49]EPT30399.1 enoyl-coa hydratase/isomerase family protein [Toxoplasma gondii ME49]ESS31543.1 enoyl-coa hydratase/isomerase family protein [Toxoplasma gondii VEG]KYK72213.1 enoyl-coa hydratase/isomerase family protein [Toxoplasma gondii TgCatPRC2]CEL73072.1 TPA: enoyl-CoA hydratase/isomerase family protein,putative [Toxoplasma gondii VEG]|eukprot:XP_002366769.1 enoyl-coa hydratase/isomerase family protein [Toxoplasma gondii ME49]
MGVRSSESTPRLDGPDGDGVFTLHLGRDENRITRSAIAELHRALDQIERSTGPAACVLCSSGKFFCNGLSITELSSESEEFLRSFQQLLKRLLGFPVPLVAAINGHAFGGGAMLACVCDYRVMRKDHGFLCVNEVLIGLPLTPGMCAVIQSKIDRSLWTSTMLRGQRWTGTEALAARIVDNVAVGDAEVLKTARRLAASVAAFGENRVVYGSIKREIYARELRALDEGNGSAAEFIEQMKGNAPAATPKL